MMLKKLTLRIYQKFSQIQKKLKKMINKVI